MKIKDWKHVRPFEYYLTPLENSITKVRTNLLDMHKRGPLFIKYVIEQNT